MKNSLLIPVALLVFLSSCSSRIELVKRKYTKGYYVSITKKHAPVKSEPSTAVVNQNKVKRAQTADSNVDLPVAKQETQNIQLASTQKVALSYPPIKANKTQQNVAKKTESHATASAQLKKNNPTLAKSEVKALPLLLKQKKELMRSLVKGGNDDTNTILLVILCIFPILALVPMYLKDGRKVTLNFWVDLILHFLLLYWLFGILVVLDVINLA